MYTAFISNVNIFVELIFSSLYQQTVDTLFHLTSEDQSRYFIGKVLTMSKR